MFESIFGPRLPEAPESIVVWTTDGLPDRLVYRRARWRVEGTPTPIIEAFEHPFITHSPSLQTGWKCRVRRDGGTETALLELRRHGDHWEAESL